MKIKFMLYIMTLGVMLFSCNPDESNPEPVDPRIEQLMGQWTWVSSEYNGVVYTDCDLIKRTYPNKRLYFAELNFSEYYSHILDKNLIKIELTEVCGKSEGGTVTAGEEWEIVGNLIQTDRYYEFEILEGSDLESTSKTLRIKMIDGLYLDAFNGVIFNLEN